MKRKDYPFYKDTDIGELLKKYKGTFDTKEEITEAAARELHDLYDITTEDAKFEIRDYLRIHKEIEVEKQREEEAKNPMMACPVCGAMVSKEAESCPHCGHPLKKKEGSLTFGWILLAVILGILICALC